MGWMDGWLVEAMELQIIIDLHFRRCILNLKKVYSFVALNSSKKNARKCIKQLQNHKMDLFVVLFCKASLAD